MRLIIALVSLWVAGAASASDQQVEAALQAVALDYALGWYTGDAERMASSLHPSLAKRALLPDKTGAVHLDHMDKPQLVAATAKGIGAKTPESIRRADVEILDSFGQAAVVKLTMHGWVDYLQLIHSDGRWQIINVLWELKPQSE